VVGVALFVLGLNGPLAGARPAIVGVEISAWRRQPLPVRALDLAFMGPDRLIALSPEEVVLLDVGGQAATVLGRRPLPGPLEVVRTPGGLLQGTERDGAFWAMTSRSPRAALFGMEGTELVERQTADALPFPGCARGLRFRPGTNLIEGEVEGLGPGPFLELAISDHVIAVSPEGRLVAPALAPESAPRVGSTLAALWSGVFAASRASPPAAPDAVLLLAREGDSYAATASWPVTGPVRALAARVHEQDARLAAVVGEEPGASLVLIDLVRRAP
jgi:hypothetical protein